MKFLSFFWYINNFRLYPLNHYKLNIEMYTLVEIQQTGILKEVEPYISSVTMSDCNHVVSLVSFSNEVAKHWKTPLIQCPFISAGNRCTKRSILNKSQLQQLTLFVQSIYFDTCKYVTNKNKQSEHMSGLLQLAAKSRLDDEEITLQCCNKSTNKWEYAKKILRKKKQFGNCPLCSIRYNSIAPYVLYKLDPVVQHAYDRFNISSNPIM